MKAHRTRRAPHALDGSQPVRLRVKLALGTATLAVLGVLAGTARKIGPAEPAAPTSAGASQVLAPIAAPPPTYPQGPRWAAADDADPAFERELEQAKERVVKSVKLPNGVEAKIYPTRPRYPAGAAIEMRAELKDERGKPISGRGGIEGSLIEADGASRKFGFYPDAREPGLYHAFVTPESERPAKSLVTVSVSETGLATTPGAVASVALPIGASGGAAIVTGPRGVIVDDRVTVTIGVRVAAPGPVALRAALVDATGATIGEATGRASLPAGRGDVIVEFPHVPVAGAEVTTLRLANMTLFAGQPLAWADFMTDAMRVRSLAEEDEIARGAAP